MALGSLFGSEQVRVHVVLLAMIAAFLFLGVVLWRVQVIRAGEYRSSLDRQSMRRVRLPGVRGRIFDRNGICLADNRPSYCIAIYIEEHRQPGKWENTVGEVEKVINRLSDALELEKQVTREEIAGHISRRLALPFLAWHDISHVTLARWAENNAEFQGVDVYVEPIRTYPLGSLAAHMLGYIGRAEPKQDPDEPYHFYLPEMEGKQGIEAVMNEVLAGIPGGRLLRVDASGFKHEKIEMGSRDPYPGRDITLAIDARIQHLAEQAMNGEKGAVVILDPRNGDVLAIVSSPSFDPNSFSPRVSRAEWKRLKSHRGKPLFNRAISGIYPPASVFKPLVAIAALESGRVTETTSFNCPGYFELGGLRFSCWNTAGHGRLTMRKAIEQSCNAFFCQLGLRCEYERIFHMAEAVGFGRKSGIDLQFESAGLLPNCRDIWHGGDTCNISIGQGALAVTPIQAAVFTAAIANGGYVYRPRLIQRSAAVVRRLPDYGGRGGQLARRSLDEGGRSEVREGELVNKLAWSEKTMSVVRGGMYDVIQAPNGTGKRARISRVAMGGKTGTAEYGPIGGEKKYAWMLAFAPFDEPRYAAAIVIEDAVSGGITAAPRVKNLMEGIFAEVDPNTKNFGVGVKSKKNTE